MILCKIDDNIVQIVFSLVTLIVGIIAIWGDCIRSKLSPLNLKIEPQNLKGELTLAINGPNIAKVYYYHLKLVNQFNWQIAKHRRVLLTGMYKKDTTGSFIYTDLMLCILSNGHLQKKVKNMLILLIRMFLTLEEFLKIPIHLL